MRLRIADLSILLVAACASVDCPNDDPVGVLKSYFLSIENMDSVQMNQLTSIDFLIYENGKIFNNDSLILFLKKSNIRISYDLKINHIETSKNLCAVIYANTGYLVTQDSNVLKKEWLESALLKKDGMQWNLYFLHSTPRK